MRGGYPGHASALTPHRSRALLPPVNPPAALRVTTERPPAPDPRITMTPRPHTGLSAFRNARHAARAGRLWHRPYRLPRVVVATAAIVAVTGGAAGTAAALSSGSVPAVTPAAESAAGHDGAGHLASHSASAARQRHARTATQDADRAVTAPRAAGHSARGAAQHPGHAAAAGRKPARHGALAARLAAHRPGRGRPAARHRPARPYTFYDSVTPGAVPPHRIVATYATGPFAVPPSAVAGRHVIWIDVYGTDPNASALDVEPTDATPAGAAAWVRMRLTAHPHALARVYCSISEWPAVRAHVDRLPAWMRSRVRWWIADPTGYPHLVPGSDATQWYWGNSYDISLAKPRF